jgi:hypothetical protein
MSVEFEVRGSANRVLQMIGNKPSFKQQMRMEGCLKAEVRPVSSGRHCRHGVPNKASARRQGAPQHAAPSGFEEKASEGFKKAPDHNDARAQFRVAMYKMLNPNKAKDFVCLAATAHR